MTWRDATRCAGLALRGVLPWCGVRCPGCVTAQRCAPPRPGVAAQRGALSRLAWWPSVARCPGLAWLPSAARRPGWRGCPAWRAAPAGMIGPALHVGLAGVTGPDGAPPRPADDPETEGGLRAYIRNPEGIATTARPLPPKKIFLSP